jgi:hypothetical protein
MIDINYQKRKNTELFKGLEERTSLFLSDAQNYIPIYTRFFSLNDTNYNSINLNHTWHISCVNEQNEDDSHLYNCRIKNNNNKIKDKEVFFKMAPLLDPYKYLIGKYPASDEKLFLLPKLNSTENDCHPKFVDTNNSAYVDGLFVYLTGVIKNKHNFIHGIDYYGSFLGIKNDFVINVFDDIDYLNNSEFFVKNKNILFKIDDYEHLFQNDTQKLKPITIQQNTSVMSRLSIKSFDNDIFENIFDETSPDMNNLVDLTDLSDIHSLDNIDNNQVTLRSTSTCSSRSSHTDDGEVDCDNCNNVEDERSVCSSDNKSNSSNNDDNHDNDDESFEEEEKINATIPKFPVQIIAMEYCETTFDELILTEDLKTEEWLSAFMQIIMMLITYQKAFGFTHNDLHTNNVMYKQTDTKYIYYCYKKQIYKVPTFGRLFKIIDFGRSIYKVDGKIFCSDSFQSGGDAATQYNTEPYLNNKKPRLEPNFSFDLCRLACSIFDYIIDDFEEIKDISKCKDPVKRLIVEWCLDDKGINMLYKNNGVDRYPDFKLYKMIARCVHNHTPQAQLERPEFNAFTKFKGEIPKDIMNIDNIPSFNL